MNGFQVYKKIRERIQEEEPNYKAEDLYLVLLGNSKKTVYDIFFKYPTDKYNEKIYSQAKIVFNLREKICLMRESQRTVLINQIQNMKKALQKEQNLKDKNQK